MAKLVATILTLIVAALAAIAGFVYSGVYDVGADEPHGNIAGWLLSTASRASIKRHASEVHVPDLSDEMYVLAGANDFKTMCAGCHGAPGQEPQAVGLGLNPPPPDLAISAGQMTPAQLFWVTKRGIRMTGMPAWGATHNDDALWPVVAFMAALPGLSAEDYQALLRRGSGSGHHAVAPGTTKTNRANGEHDHTDHAH